MSTKGQNYIFVILFNFVRAMEFDVTIAKIGWNQTSYNDCYSHYYKNPAHTAQFNFNAIDLDELLMAICYLRSFFNLRNIAVIGPDCIHQSMSINWHLHRTIRFFGGLWMMYPND